MAIVKLQTHSGDMISRQKMQQKSENCSLVFIQTVHLQYRKVQHCQRPLTPALAVFNFTIHRITFYDPERPEGIDNCTKYGTTFYGRHTST